MRLVHYGTSSVLRRYLYTACFKEMEVIADERCAIALTRFRQKKEKVLVLKLLHLSAKSYNLAIILVCPLYLLDI